MSDTVTITTNVSNVIKQLYDYSDKLGNKLALNAVKEGGKYIAQQLANEVPVRKGTLQKNIFIKKSKIKTPRRTGEMSVFVSFRRGKRAKIQTKKYNFLGVTVKRSTKVKDAMRLAYYARFVNSGTKFQKAQRFVERTNTTHGDRAVQIVIAALEKGSQILGDSLK